MKNKLLVTTILIAAIVLVVNFISREFFFRLDFTEDNQYTLSNATKDILKNLKEPISIKAYFSEDLAPEIGKYRDEYKEMLIEYSTLSNGMLVYEFLNPTGEGKKDIETQAMQEGIQPFMIDKRENDKVEQQKAYMGVVISMGSQKEVIPVIPPGGAMEYETSKAIKKISTPEKPSIGLLQGHGEPGMQEMQQVYHELTILYNFEPLSLTDSTVIPERIKTIALVRPNDSIPQKHLDQLDAFMARGGRMLICMNRVDFNMQMGYGMEKNTGLEGWLQKKGLIVNNNFVYDINCASANVPQQMGPIQVYAQVAIPYVPIIKRFANHPAVKGLEGVMFKFVSSMDYMGDSSKHFTPLAFTSDQSAVAPPPISFNPEKQWTQADFPLKKITIAGALEGNISGGTPTKMIVIADGDFAINGGGQNQQPERLNPDNVNMFVNCIDWLSDDTGLIELRTKTVMSRPIKDLEDGTRSFLKWLNFLLPILLVIAYGVFRMQQRRAIRVKRQEENYG